MSHRTPRKSVIVNISDFSKKGHGLGMSEEQTPHTVEVPFTIPGDRARALLQRKRGGVFSSQLEEVLSASPLRITPRCRHFGQCGGCKSQHIPYEKQLNIKQNHINTLFSALVPSSNLIRSIIPCDPPWEYRNKMEFSFSMDASGNHFLGLILDGSRGKVLNLVECHLVRGWFTEVLDAVRKWWIQSGLKAYHPHSNTGSLRTLIVREGMRTGDRMVMLTVSGNADYALTREQIDTFTAAVRTNMGADRPLHTNSIFLRIQQTLKGTPTNFYEMLLDGADHIKDILHIEPRRGATPVDLTFSISPSAFFQPNTRQAEKLYSIALQLLDIPEDSIVYDLYCGTGTLGICAAQRAKQVLGIEISPESSLDGRENATRNRTTNVTILTGPVDQVLEKIRQECSFPPPDVVMVDPPRAGLDAHTIRHLQQLNPKKILYISCNPTTQTSDVEQLLSFGYTITAVQPVDQFPHTVHCENIVVLEKLPVGTTVQTT